MRSTFLALAIVVSGMSGNLQAARHPQGAVHKVRRGETPARIARENGITVKELEALNPKVNFARLAVGTRLRVVGQRRVAALPRLRVRARTPVQPEQPLAPLPDTPAPGPGTLVHLERILPAEGLSSAPGPLPATGSSSAQPATAATPSLAGMRPVLSEAGDEPAEVLTVPAAAPSAAFTPADRANIDLLWPVSTRTISSAWGPRMRTRVVRIKTRTRFRRVTRRFLGTHKGVDLSAPKGTDIYAAMDGQVVASGRQKEYGNYVAVDHGSGVVTLYAHCSRNFVTVGEIVRRGQKIAEVGRTGNATGPHLHFELRLDGIPVNPLPQMNDMEEIPADLMAQNQAATAPASRR